MFDVVWTLLRTGYYEESTLFTLPHLPTNLFENEVPDRGHIGSLTGFRGRIPLRSVSQYPDLPQTCVRPTGQEASECEIYPSFEVCPLRWSRHVPGVSQKSQGLKLQSDNHAQWGHTGPDTSHYTSLHPLLTQGEGTTKVGLTLFP